ncbi:unnamed protein product, partial [Adineta steineri]
MGCGNSSSVHVVSDTSESEPNINSQQSVSISDTEKLLPGALLQKKKRKSITSNESHSNVQMYNIKNSSIHSSHDVNQNIVIIWADANIDQSKKTYHDSITKLQRITPAVYSCTNSPQCINYLNNINDKKVFLIVSDGLGEELVPLVHDKPQLDAIYIYSQVKMQRLPWANKWSQKVKEILFTMEDIYQKIKADSGLVGSLVPISIIRRMDVPSSTANELDQSFMYTQLLKEILLEMKHDPEAKAKLVEYCRSKYADDILQLGIIDDFSIEYNNLLAIEWYTKESFLYGLLNRALRTEDVETIMKMGFFLKDLHQQIVELHSAQSKTRDGDKFTVYRGQGMAPEELEKIKDSEGGLLSFNNFLSTTYNEEIAKDFAKKIHTNSKVVAIIFQMEINPKKSSVPFAFIDKESTYKYESENLFSMHTVFRIMGTRKLADRFWQVNLALTSDNDPQLKLLSDYMRKELGEGNSLSKLGHLMLKMGEFDQAHDIYGSQLDSSDKQNWRRHSYLNHQLGWVFSQKGEYKTALSYYE